MCGQKGRICVYNKIGANKMKKTSLKSVTRQKSIIDISKMLIKKAQEKKRNK